MDAKSAVEEGVQAGSAGVLGDAGGDALASAVARPGEEAVGTEAATVGVPGAGSSELAEALSRIAALETEQVVLQAREARRAVAESVAGMRFGEDGKVLAPSSRSALVEALMPLGSEQRASVLSALQSQQFVALGERGFTSAVEADAETLSAAEEQHVRALASRNRLGFEEVKAQFLAVRRRRAA